MKRGKFLMVMLVVSFVLVSVGSVFANSGYLNDWKAAYPGSASSTFSCSLCHTSAPALNGYGDAALAANFNFASIESQDSDGDGATNIAEMNAGTNPGDSNSKPAPAAEACTDYTYSEWSACANGQQTRTQTGYLPANCTGTPSAQPVLSQACNSVPPFPATGTVPVPTGAQAFSYQPVDLPVVSDDPAQAKPVGVGPVASGGDTIDLRVNIGPFAGPVNAYLAIYGPAVDSEDLFFIVPGVGLRKLSDAVRDEDRTESDSDEHDSSHDRRRRVRDRVVWKTNVTSVDEVILTAKTSDLPSGLYPLVLSVTSPDNPDNAYRWITYLFVP